MDSKGFVNEIFNQVITGGMNVYQDLFSNTDLENVTDEYWKRALAFFNNLGEQERTVFFEIVRQISVDTTAEILAILDGVSRLEHQEEEFSLTVENSSEPLNGDLKDIFLELEEDFDGNDLHF